VPPGTCCMLVDCLSACGQAAVATVVDMAAPVAAGVNTANIVSPVLMSIPLAAGALCLWLAATLGDAADQAMCGQCLGCLFDAVFSN